jgi:hypothetical protein
MNARKPLLALAALLLVTGVVSARLNRTTAGLEMAVAAKQFLEALPEAQRAQASLAYDDPARLDWHFIPKDQRKGLKIGEMAPTDRQRALVLLRAGLSQIGYDKATTIMSLEKVLHELEKHRPNRMIRDSERYYVTIFGQPAATGRWGWSLEGHHLSLNFTVLDGAVFAHTPAMFGANPAIVKSSVGVGPPVGQRTLAKEESLAFDLLHSLSAEQRKTAVIAEKAPADVRGAGEPQAVTTPLEGLPAAQMTPDQVKALRDLLSAYAGNMPPEVGEADLAAIDQAGVDKVHFAWAGPDRPGIGHYYRVQGPTFVLEFCNTQPDSAGNPANHIHSVWRSTSGDFGLHQ